MGPWTILVAGTFLLGSALLSAAAIYCLVLVARRSLVGLLVTSIFAFYALAGLNWLACRSVGAFLGGSAQRGRVENGAHHLLEHGRATPVPKEAFDRLKAWELWSGRGHSAAFWLMAVTFVAAGLHSKYRKRPNHNGTDGPQPPATADDPVEDISPIRALASDGLALDDGTVVVTFQIFSFSPADPRHHVLEFLHQHGGLNRNVFRIDSVGKVLWQIADHYWRNSSNSDPFTKVILRDDRLVGFTGAGFEYEIEISSGSLRLLHWSKR